MVEHGEELLGKALTLAARAREEIEGISGLHALAEEFHPLAFEHDPLKIVIDVAELGITGYQAADHLAERHLHVGLSDHRRIAAQITHADDEDTVSALLHGLRGLTDHDFERRPPVDLPSGADLKLETRMLPRDAFFAEAEHVPLDKAEGRVSAEMISPYPPGVPAIAPGEVFTEAIIDYLHTGVRTGMFIYDAADPELGTVRVVG